MLAIGAIYSVALLFLAFQAFLPNMCTHSICRLVNVTKDSFGLLIFFGVHTWVLSALWFALVGLEKYVLEHSPELYSRRNYLTALVCGVASGSVMVISILFPLLVGMFWLIVSVLGAVLGLILMLR